MKSLWNGTEKLFKTFSIDPSLQEQNRKFAEESYEFIEALFMEDTYYGYEGEAAKELVDVIVVGFRQLQKLGYTREQFEAAILKTELKNAAKTLESHEVKNGMIVRKGK